MIISDGSSSYQKNLRKCPLTCLLQPNGFISFNALSEIYFSKEEFDQSNSPISTLLKRSCLLSYTYVTRNHVLCTVTEKKVSATLSVLV